MKVGIQTIIMKRILNLKNRLILLLAALPFVFTIQSCVEKPKPEPKPIVAEAAAKSEKPVYFSLRPELEKAFGYTHAVKVGSSIKISGAVSMDEEGNPTAVGDMGQQIKNCYADLEKILDHFGCSFEDVIVENIFTTDMASFLQNSGYRSEIYTKGFPTGSWVGVKELVTPEFLIEIELEVHKSD